MAVPKRRTSKTRGAKRRTHKKSTLFAVVECPQCGDPRLPHRVCPSCGVYKGREEIKVE